MPRGTGKAQTDGKDETGVNSSLCGCPEGGGATADWISAILSLGWVSIHFPAGLTRLDKVSDEVPDKGRPKRAQNCPNSSRKGPEAPATGRPGGLPHKSGPK